MMKDKITEIEDKNVSFVDAVKKCYAFYVKRKVSGFAIQSQELPEAFHAEKYHV